MKTPSRSDMERKLASSRGGREGGRIRAEKLSPEKRIEIAKKAAEARWSKKNS